MYRKVLSVLVMCCFVYSTACFAAPTANLPLSLSVKSTVDNMALPSFLKTGDVSTLQDKKTKDAFTQLLAAQASQEYDNVDQMFEAWASNLKTKGVENTVAQINKDLGLALVVSLDTAGNISLDAGDGQSMKAEGPEQRAELIALANKQINEAVKEGKSTQISKERKAADRADLKAMLDKSNIRDDRKQQILNLFEDGNVAIHDFTAVIIDINNRLHGFSKSGNIYIDTTLDGEARTDLILHELLELLIAQENPQLNEKDRDKKTMQEQMGIHNIKGDNERKNTNNVMSRTKNAMEDSARKVTAEKSSESTADKIAEMIEDKKAEITDDDVQNIVKEVAPTLPADQADLLRNALPAEQKKTIQLVIADWLNKKANDIKAAMKVFVSNLFTDANLKQATSGMDAKDVKNIVEAGDKAALHLNDIAEYDAANKVYLLKESVVVMLQELKAANVKKGMVNFIGLGEAFKNIEHQLALLGLQEVVDLQKDNVGAVALTGDQKVRVIYSKGTESAIQRGVKNAVYIQVEGFNQQANMMQVLVKSLQLKVELGKDGVVQLAKEDFIEPTSFEALKDAYKTIKEMLVQA
ncbi:MAG: hypothetical protein PHO30_06005 [Candidatus Omnitrophica bacterium]|nr:hypothetical protein [Candidatus Omnitrophota bacterium]